MRRSLPTRLLIDAVSLYQQCYAKLREEVLIPLCKSIQDTITDDDEKQFVAHLRNEIQRLKRTRKTDSSNKGQCLM